LTSSRRTVHVSGLSPNWATDPTGVGHKGAHVGMARHSGPVPGKDPSAELVLLAEPHSSHTGPLEPEVESADAGEK